MSKVLEDFRDAVGLPKQSLTEKRFPPKATDFNKLPDTDGFWNWDVQEAARLTGLRTFSPSYPKTVADVIFWLNMVADTWETRAGKK